MERDRNFTEDDIRDAVLHIPKFRARIRAYHQRLRALPRPEERTAAQDAQFVLIRDEILRLERLVSQLEANIKGRMSGSTGETRATYGDDDGAGGDGGTGATGTGKRGGARTTASALIDVATHPANTVNDFKTFFGLLAGIWNGGDVAAGLRTSAKPAVQLMIKYLPLAGAPGYAAATSIERLKIDDIIELLATLIDLCTGKADLKKLFDTMKVFVGNIWELVQTLAKDVAPALANAAWQGALSVGGTIQEALSPEIKAQNEAYRKSEALIAAENATVENVTGSIGDAALQTIDDEPPTDVMEAIGQGSETATHIGGYGTLTFSTHATEEFNKAYTQFEIDMNAKHAPGAESSYKADSILNQGKKETMRAKFFVPWFLYIRDHMKDLPAPFDNLAPLPSWDANTWFNNATSDVNPSAPSDYTKALKPFVDSLTTASAANHQERMDNQLKAAEENSAMESNRVAQEFVDGRAASVQAARDIGLEPMDDIGFKTNPTSTPQDREYKQAVYDNWQNKESQKANPTVSYNIKTDAEMRTLLRAATASHTAANYAKLADEAYKAGNTEDDQGYRNALSKLDPAKLAVLIQEREQAEANKNYSATVPMTYSAVNTAVSPFGNFGGSRPALHHIESRMGKRFRSDAFDSRFFE